MEKSFLVIIGVNKCEKWQASEFCVNDSKAVKQKLEEIGFDDITIILDKDATQKRVLIEFSYELARKIRNNDRDLFCFAGHGQAEDSPDGGEKGHIIPGDADTWSYASTAISMEQIGSLPSRIPARGIPYVMDSCYSGFGPSTSYGVSFGRMGYLIKVACMRGVQIVAATRTNPSILQVGRGTRVSDSYG